MKVAAKWAAGLVVLALSGPGWCAKKVDLDYHVKLLPQSQQAEVRVSLSQGAAVRSLNFDLGRDGDYSDFKADGQWQITGNRGLWQPSADKASLTYRVRLAHARKPGVYDTRITPGWALLRGEDLVPAARLDQQDGVELVSRLMFELPTGWKSVETAWPRIGQNKFRIDNVSRLFDRPTGWMLAGNLGSRRLRLGDTDVTVASPKGQGMRRMDVLTLLTFVWPQVEAAFPRHPGKLLIVGASDPMRRGAYSLRDSIYLNSRTPLVGENGSSPLLREVVQAIGRFNDHDSSDWISEGLGEYYAIELMRRAGGITDERYAAIQARLTKEGKDVSTLKGEHVNGATLARSVVVLQELDREIRVKTHNKRSLDDLAQAVMRVNSINTKEFVQLAESVIGESSVVLDSKLLR
ncbi:MULTISPECIES: hypothetical protein [unclassified Pseudomonas]|jgi:hypothetical protein|uniref:hypothetical protein n=1 Tax=unclassified Pseudomonas TaxID=196821 RepID=UPI00025E862D|nr:MULTISPECIES: hypothetical protein [unclassified Pseudomonas]AFJ59332.1 hypothetical protein PflA506_1537 [Pseudomonas fluorescens A506]MBJ2238160.1 hypothetical protein [Pseudomonas fluorescens]PMZ71464.1 hypothetical protein C1X25_13920 [Pseudomonas sp. GW247-3R2A]MBJ2318472.1 hypothetical protein [Pseudomonas fluorescens]MEA9989114.1 hypothetical protein [Pseudomonas sp. RTS1]